MLRRAPKDDLKKKLNMKTNNERRNFFKKAGVSVMSAGFLSAIPATLFSKLKHEMKDQEQKTTGPIKINPMAVKRKQK